MFRGNKWLGGWSLDGTFIIQSGSPFSITDPADTNHDGYAGDQSENFGTGSPMSTVTHRLSPADGYIDPNKTSLFAATTVPASPGWADGMLSRNSMTGPIYTDTDMSISKVFKFNERFALKVVASGFNVFNHPNFAIPSGSDASPSFGQSLSDIAPNNSSTGARVLQFAPRIDF